jgi:methyl-accepting chemotaxis protein
MDLTRSIKKIHDMTPNSSYSLQRTMIIYFLLIGFAALLVATEFVLDTHSTALKKELGENFQRHHNGELPAEQIYDPLVRIRNKAMMMVGVILAVVVIVLTMFIKTITEPLQHMVEVSKAISTGDLSRTTKVETRNELCQLSAAIDDMSSNLQEIVMLSRSVCDSTASVMGKSMELINQAAVPQQSSHAVVQQLNRLESELAMLRQVIDFFKLYSVDDQP